MKKLCEVLILLMACLAPWAFGAEDACAGLGLGLGIALVTLLTTAAGWRSDRLRSFLCGPSLALGGLVVLGVLQAAPLPARVARVLAPADWTFRSVLAPREPERVAGDEHAAVKAPASTLSVNPEASLTAACRLAGAWLLLQAVLALDDPRGVLRRFGLATAVNACALALVSMIQWLSWNGKVLWIREAPRPAMPWYSGGPFACHNHLAAYLNVGLGFALALLLSSGRGISWYRKRGAQLWPAYGVAILVVGLLASHSRGGLLAAAFALGVLVLTALTSRRVRGELIVPGVGLLLVLATVGLALAAAGTHSPFARLATLSEADSDMRWEVWGLALRSWCDRPLWGAGLGCFGAALVPRETRDFGYSFRRAENEYLDVLVEGGVVGLALLLVVLGGAIFLARRALGQSGAPRDRALVLGGCFGGLALTSHWLVDFSFHIPAVAYSALVLGGLLCGIGLSAAPAPALVPTGSRRSASRLAGLAVSALALVFLIPPLHQARAELRLARAGLPLPGSSNQRDRLADRTRPEVERTAAAIKQALGDRPDWAEGHLRHAAALIRLYELAAAELIASQEPDPERVAALAQPLWLRKQVHGGMPQPQVPIDDLLAQEPIRAFLVPAARSYLEARRCCSILAQPHIQLANFDYLLEGGDSSGVYLGRALRLAGGDRGVIELAAVLAVQGGDLDLAARAWRRVLEVGPDSWERIADAADAALDPNVILRDVIPPNDGVLMIRFTDRLYATDATRVYRDLFLRQALARLPVDARLSAAERLAYQAIVQARLGDTQHASRLIGEALLLEPTCLPWRQLLIEWLMTAGELKQARRQLAVALELYPADPGLTHLRRSLVETLASGRSGGPTQLPKEKRLATSDDRP